MKKVIKILLVITILFLSSSVFAASVSLTIRDGDTFILPTSTFQIQPGDTVLTVLNTADQVDSTWSISNLQHYSFGDYIKCITSPSGEACDNWQYTVNNSYPFDSINQKVLSDRDVVYLYFGPQNKIILSSNNITTNNTLTVTAQKYDYQNNAWITKTGVTLGLTQPKPDPNSWSPIEVQTSAVDGNGQVVFSSIPVGSYNVGIKEDGYFPTEALTVTNPPVSHGGSGGALAAAISAPTIPNLSPTPVPVIKKEFDIKKALKFITSQQKENGSFGEDLYTDWAAVALAERTDFQIEREKLIKYFKELKTNDYQLTDYQRHAMGLMSLGLNPYNTNGENYIKKIIDSFDGKQFGNIKEENDDIFALIVLQNAGYTKDENIIKDTVTFILSKQKENGSWDENADMTGAGIQALASFNQDEKVKNTLTKAREFLKQNQKDDGGWGNVSSTAWVIGGIFALSEKPEDWIKNDNTPLDYLGVNQDTDGEMKNLPTGQAGDNIKSKLWETAYAASALSGKTWNQIMQKFEKPQPTPLNQNKETLAPQKIEEKLQKQNITRKLNLKKTSVATVIKAISEQKTTEAPQPIKKSWFRNLLEKILNFF